MRLPLLALTLATITAAPAQARPSTLDLTCGQAAALVVQYGAIVLSTGTHTFDRFVSSEHQCFLNEYGERAFAPTRDNPSCRLGYVCRSRPAPFEDLFRFR